MFFLDVNTSDNKDDTWVNRWSGFDEYSFSIKYNHVNSTKLLKKHDYRGDEEWFQVDSFSQ